MKKLLFLCAAFALSITVFSQARFGIKGGANFANQKIKVSLMGQDFDQSGDGIVSFHIGGVAEVPIAQNFAFRPELLLSGKGMNFEGEDDNGDPVEAKIRPFYLELPLNVVYTHEFPTGLRFYGGAGPSIAYGLFGKVKSGGEEEDAFQDEGFKRFDFGINILAGIELNSGLTLGVNFTPGLANITEAEDPGGFGADVKWTNSVFGVSVGYMFGRKQQ
jgi:hypothetical protein